MLDQNVATLLAALIGGALTITGGFIANYYTQRSKEKKDKRKEVHEILETIYKKSLEIENYYGGIATEIHFLEGKDSTTKAEEILEKQKFSSIFPALAEMNMLVDLYIPQLNDLFSDYVSYLDEMNDSFISIKNGSDKEKELDKVLSLMNKARKSLSNAIIEILKEKGFSYF